KCLEHLRVLITPESHAESEIEYSRKFLQRAYQEVPEILDNIATAKEGDIIRKSLMAGRVYYHAVRYGKVEDDHIKSDYEDRFNTYIEHIYPSDDFRQNSNEKVVKELVRDGKVIPKEERSTVLNYIEQVCREDIARIESLRERIKSRQIF